MMEKEKKVTEVKKRKKSGQMTLTKENPSSVCWNVFPITNESF